MCIATRHHFTDPNEIYDLAQQLARHFPHADDIVVGIHELLLNAVEHGNLGIDTETKETLLRNGMFSAEIARRLTLPANSNKYVEVEVDKDERFIRLSIQDQGNGFDWRKCISTLGNARSLHGRGLMIAMECGFDKVDFNEKGNRVTCFFSAHG